MSSTDNTEKTIRLGKPRIETGSEMDKQVLDDSFAAMDETIRAKPAGGKPNTWKMIVQSKTTKVAAAMIIVAIGLFVVHRGPNERPATAEIPRAAKSPGEMMTAISLNLAYRRGGIEAVDRQCKEAIEMLGPRPAELTVEKMLTEFNGT